MKKYIYLVILFFTLAIAGCKKSYLDINTNPNSITDVQSTPELLLPQALNATATNSGAGGAVLARWMGYWSRGGDYGQSAEEEQYQITTSFGTGTWNAWYNNLYDYTLLQQKSHETGQKMYEGIATAMKTVGFMSLTDFFNDVPYTEAFDVIAHPTPKYDKAEDIYKDLFVQLDNALVLIDAETGTPLSTDLVNTDIIFGGDKAMWRKFINTMRLKLLLRLVNTTGIVDRDVQLGKITSEGYLGSGESAQADPGYTKSLNVGGVSQQNPFWNAYFEDVNSNPIDKYNRAASRTLNDYMSNGDIRYKYFYAAAVDGGAYAGSIYGATGGASNSQSGVGPGLAKSFDQAQWFLTSVESLFLQAEAISRGWAINGANPTPSVTDAYKAAVEESFIWLGVPNGKAVADNYIAAGGPLVAAGVPTTTDILKQKYYSLNGIANAEAWVDYRRINTANGSIYAGVQYPKPPISTNTAHLPNIPLRYLYPKSEYDYNAFNVPATPQNALQAQTIGVFWDTSL